MPYPKGTKRRSILWPPERQKAVQAACDYLECSGQEFITLAIIEYLRQTYERMLVELPRLECQRKSG